MTRARHTLAMLFLSAFLAAPALAQGDRQIVKPHAARTFAEVPEGVRFPEGITADPKSRSVYVGTFDFGGGNALLRFRQNGRLEASRSFGATPLLGLAFEPAQRQVYIANTGALVGDVSRIQRIAADFDAATAVEDVALVPAIGAPAARTVDNPDGSTDQINFGNLAAAPNGLVFAANGDLYFSDSFQGAIFRIPDPAANCPGACDVELVAHDPLLATAGFPPFGANGLALAADDSALFVANTGDDRVLRVDLASGAVAVFAESLNGADGLAMGDQGTLWVAANQADRVIGLDSDGRVVAELGAFLGVRRDASPRGLLFPASLVILDGRLLVTNLALPLTGAVGDEPEEQVSRYTVSEIRLSGGPGRERGRGEDRRP